MWQHAGYAKKFNDHHRSASLMVMHELRRSASFMT
jgi:hypothetical protein